MAKKQLVGQLATAMEEIIAGRRVNRSVQPFQRTASIPDDPSRYIAGGEVIVRRDAFDGEQVFTAPQGAMLYLPISPVVGTTMLKRAEALALTRESLPPLYPRSTGEYRAHNGWGAIAFDANSETGAVVTGAQLFLNHEVWLFDNAVLRRQEEHKEGMPTLSVEEAFARALAYYPKFMREKLGLNTPFHIEVGAYGVENFVLYMPANYHRQAWGPIQQDHICWEGQLHSTDNKAIDEILLAIFEEFFDAAGRERPARLHNFPGNEPVASRSVLEFDLARSPAGLNVADQAARSMGRPAGFTARVFHPSTFRILICPEATSAQNIMAAVSAEGSTVCVLIRRLKAQQLGQEINSSRNDYPELLAADA